MASTARSIITVLTNGQVILPKMAQAANCDAFVTFDRSLARAAKRLGALEVRGP
jgi:hypothetical protein